ncbi:MAG: hypothetical protein K1X79_01315 [Oligoflexia bacterium]|nr:hypothetical protein [Oligoflexia bacterium]
MSFKAVLSLLGSHVSIVGMKQHQTWISLFLAIGLGLILTLASSYAWAEPDSERVGASPKRPWGDFALDKGDAPSEQSPWWAQVLLWIPNRVMDFVDIFRADVGVGPAMGGVVRVTRYGQVGYRQMTPLSVRVGLFGRKAPVMLEHSSEFGLGPGFISSKDRSVCKGEIGVGADAFVAGAYAGVCVDEIIDFLAGIFFLDVSGDDIK